MQECKSIGTDVNWGVRFQDMKDVSTLLHMLFLFLPSITKLNQPKF